MTTVKVWHNAKWHIINYNTFTAPILQRMYHTNPNEYMNPLESEWTVLNQHRDRTGNRN